MTAPGAAGDLRDAVASEWVKLRSVRSTWWCLAATMLLTAAYVLIFGLSASASAANGEAVPPMTPVDVAAAGLLMMGQFGLVTLAVLTIAGEYATGSIVSSLQCVPRRLRLLGAKALLLAPVLFVSGFLVSLVASAVAVAALGDAAGEWTPAGLLAGSAALGLYASAVGVITVGLGAMIRSVAGTLGVVFLLVLVLPMALMESGVEILVKLGSYFPGSAGMALLAGEGPEYPAAVAVAVLGAWGAACLSAGGAVFRRRDAL